MEFSRRLKLFLTGVFLGTVLVYFTLIKDTDRGNSTWLPNERVLHSIKKNFSFENAVNQCFISCCQISKDDLNEALESGKVNFEKSTPRAKPATYWVSYKNKTFEFALYEDKAQLISVSTCKTTDCPCYEK
jgi:hypothetical protein